MSRTYRRKNVKHDLWWYLLFHGNHPAGLARYHSDAYKGFKEPGPAWFRNMFTERPQRRDAHRQLRAYMKGEIEDVVLNAMDRLTYWT